jgi:hypothetical protein
MEVSMQLAMWMVCLRVQLGSLPGKMQNSSQKTIGVVIETTPHREFAIHNPK